MDGPERLLSSAVTTLPEHRRRWGEAMLAELAQVHGRPAGWRFALSAVGVGVGRCLLIGGRISGRGGKVLVSGGQ